MRGSVCLAAACWSRYVIADTGREQASCSGSWALAGSVVGRLLVFEPEAVVAAFGSLFGSLAAEMKQRFAC